MSNETKTTSTETERLNGEVEKFGTFETKVKQINADITEKLDIKKSILDPTGGVAK